METIIGKHMFLGDIRHVKVGSRGLDQVGETQHVYAIDIAFMDEWRNYAWPLHRSTINPLILR